MRKITALIIAFLVLFISQASFVWAQKEIEDYFFQYEKYRNVYNDFVTAKEAYLKYQTLTSKDEAIETTQKLIDQRYQALRTYFLALKSKLRTAPGVVGADYREQLISQLDKEINWLENQKGEVNGLSKPSLDDLFVISDRFEDKSEEIKSLSYQSLSAFLLGKVRSLYSDSVVITDFLKDEVFDLEVTQAAQMTDWLKEVENKNYLSQKEIELAEANLELLKKKKRENQMVPIYHDLKVNLNNSKQYLSQAYQFQQEIFNILNKIKNTDNSVESLEEENGSGL